MVKTIVEKRFCLGLFKAISKNLKKGQLIGTLKVALLTK